MGADSCGSMNSSMKQAGGFENKASAIVQYAVAGGSGCMVAGRGHNYMTCTSRSQRADKADDAHSGRKGNW